MAHPVIANGTPFAVEPLFITDEEGRPIVSVIVKATLFVSAAGEVAVADEQAKVDFEGVAYGEPGLSSYRFEPETAYIKPGTDLVLVGHAHAQQPGSVWLDVNFAVGEYRKSVRVWGDRHVTGTLGYGISEPQPFERMPLTYERAYGGWDRSSESPERHLFDPRNPVGVGFRAKGGTLVEGDPIPNIEDPRTPLLSPTQVGVPVGFGFVSPDWQPRAGFAGTYDESWAQHRAPLLPTDFDRRFFNAASPGLVATGYLRGDEAVHVEGATPEGRWAFWLPGIPAPVCMCSMRHKPDEAVPTNLDTVIVDGDSRVLTLIWRGMTTLRDGPLDVRTIAVDTTLPSTLVPAASSGS